MRLLLDESVPRRLIRRGDVVIAKTDPPLISVVAAGVTQLRGAGLVNWLQDLFPEVASALGVRGMNTPLAAVLQRLRNASLRTARINVVVEEAVATAGGAPSRLSRIKSL